MSEVGQLRAEVELLKAQSTETREKHNLLVTISGKEFRNFDARLDDHKYKLSITETILVSHQELLAALDAKTLQAKALIDGAELVVTQLKIASEEGIHVNEENLTKMAQQMDSVDKYVRNKYVPDSMESRRVDFKKNLTQLKEQWMPKAFEQFKQDVFGEQLQVHIQSIAFDSVEKLTRGVQDTLEVMHSRTMVLERDLESLGAITHSIGTTVEDTVNRLSSGVGGGCPCASGRCPCRCNKDPLQDPAKDSWATGLAAKTERYVMTPGAERCPVRMPPGFPQGGECPGRGSAPGPSGPRGDGHGRGGPSGPSGPGGGSDGDHRRVLGPAPTLTLTSKLFEEKTARDPRYGYDGISRGAEWRSETRDYLLSKCPHAESILTWAEELGSTKITDELMVQCAAMTELDPRIFSFHLWGFLHHCLTGMAKRLFKCNRRRCGLDVWRELVLSINTRTDCSRHGLRRACQNPKQAPSNDKVMEYILDWETSYNVYLDAGGRSS